MGISSQEGWFATDDSTQAGMNALANEAASHFA